MSPADQPLSSLALAAFLEGEVTGAEADRIAARLRGCAISRQRLERLRELRRTLSDLPEELAGVDLVSGVRQAIASGAALRGTRVGASRPLWWAAGLVGAAAILALVVWPRDPGAAELVLRDKAAGGAIEPADRWVGLEVFRTEHDGRARPLDAGGAMQSQDVLVFRYNNVGTEPFDYLMVFGIDAAGEVHWYYPAYDVAGSNPRSLTIRSGAVAMPLPDAIQHDLPPGPLVIYGVFSREPLSVLEVERAVATLIARDGWNAMMPPRIPVARSGQHVISVNVNR